MKAASRAGAYTTSPFFCTSRHRSRLPTTRDVPCRTRVVPVARSNLTLDRRSPSNMRNSLFYTAGSRNFWLQERRCGATSWTSVSNKLPLLLAAADFTGKSHDYKKETSRCKKKISVKNDYVTKGSSEHKTLGIVSKASVCTGMLARIPVVCPSVDILNSGIKRASRMTPTKGLKDATLKERNRCSKQIDALTTSLCKPLGEYVKFFPRLQRLHPFERALLELTLRDEHYETTLHQVNLLRKGLLSIGKQSAARAAQARGPKEATNIRQKCFDELKCYFNQHGHHVDNLKEIAKALRRLPVAELRTPTMALVGAPNVGKSSIVRVLSSGTPHVCNYPFTTRAIKMGHFFIDSERYTITDTPGLLWRPDSDRNKIEKLALATLEHLPTCVIYVTDLSGFCGTSIADQLSIRADLFDRFAHRRPWIDVLSKSKFVPALNGKSSPELDGDWLLERDEDAATAAANLIRAGALAVSVEEELGILELSRAVSDLLLSHKKTLA